MRTLAALLLAAGLAAGLGLAAPAGKARAGQTLTLGTGAVTGAYHPMGEAIQMLVNRDTEGNGLAIAVEPTEGAVANIEGLRRGRLDLGFVQSDIEFQALSGLPPFAGEGPFTELRALFSTHTEAFTVVARGDSGIRSLADLAGRRVNIGPPGSGTRALMELVMDSQGWTPATFAAATELSPDAAPEALCGNRIDAMVFAVGHPNGAILRAVAGCRSVIVPVTGAPLDRLLAAHSFLVRTTIPGGMYAGTPGGIPTFGVRAVLATTGRLPTEAGYAIVKAVFENLDLFRWLHPALAGLDREQMVREGVLAPLHDGAARYYREAGLIP